MKAASGLGSISVLYKGVYSPLGPCALNKVPLAGPFNGIITVQGLWPQSTYIGTTLRTKYILLSHMGSCQN